MKLSNSALGAVMTATVKAASGSFYLTTFDATYGDSDGPLQVNSWKISGELATCANMFDGQLWSDLDDVSGSKAGVRFKGTLSDPLEIEMNVPSLGHWTIYKNRDYRMVDVRDVVVGQAALAKHGDSLVCELENGQVLMTSVVQVDIL